ncbi:MAG: bifunctional folylpolyglutamate synthase/dihydrofolate synthase [Acidobacteriaceae bacterium]
MTYEDVLERLKLLGPELRTGRAGEPSSASPAAGARRKFSLDHIRSMLRALGDPQQSFRSVLIAGTNGKGSTASSLASITHASGLKTGLYTSPHLLRVNERIKVSGQAVGHPGSVVNQTAWLKEIPDADFARIYQRVDRVTSGLIAATELPHYPSYFELMTAIGLTWFAEQRVELAVLEVGLGGRLDATNSVEPIVSVITDIGIDHTEYLGDTIGQIAREKAGILRPHGVLVTLAQHPEANAAIGETATRLEVRGVDAARCLPPSRSMPGAGERSEPLSRPASPLGRNTYDLVLEGAVVHVDSPLSGQHQQRNIALAIATALELRANHQLLDGRPMQIPNPAIEEGLRQTQWPGRLEWIGADAESLRAPLLLDVAHNPAGAWTLRAALSYLPEDLPRTLIFACLADKKVDEIEQVLLPLFDSTSSDPARRGDHVILAPIAHPRASTVAELAAAAERLNVPVYQAGSVAEALQHAWAVTPPEGVIVATGSVFLVGEIRSLALGRHS